MLEVSRRVKSISYDESTKSHRLRRVSLVIKSRLELSYDLLAIVRARFNENATALSNDYHVVVARVRFLTSATSRVDYVDVANASYDYHAC